MRNYLRNFKYQSRSAAVAMLAGLVTHWPLSQ